jgi:hypothetical protein
MSEFEFLSVALSFVLGLAVTLLLTSFLIAFRARRRTRMSWVPLTWAIYVLVMQFDLWWETYGLSSMGKWSVGGFVLLLAVAFALFAAGGLVLPVGTDDYPKDLDEYFREDGRWGVGMVAVFLIFGSIANVALFDVEAFGAMNRLNAVGLVLAVVVVLARRRTLRATATVLYGIYLATYLWTFVPRSY